MMCDTAKYINNACSALATLWTRINMLYANLPKEIPYHWLQHRDD